MLGEMTFRPCAINTFSGRGKMLTTLTPVHYVRPHYVSAYTRRDGTVVGGYWRDGDGNTKIYRSFGYFAGNPNAIPPVWGKGRKR